MKTLVDNFSVLAVEKCTLGNLDHVLSPNIVMKLSDELVSSIAAESEESMLERQRTTEKLKTLKEGLTTLNLYNQLRSTSTPPQNDLLVSTIDKDVEANNDDDVTSSNNATPNDSPSSVHSNNPDSRSEAPPSEAGLITEDDDPEPESPVAVVHSWLPSEDEKKEEAPVPVAESADVFEETKGSDDWGTSGIAKLKKTSKKTTKKSKGGFSFGGFGD